MIFRSGIDIVEVRRISALMEKSGDRFLHRHFTDEEIRFCRGKSRSVVHFAGNFTAKEAVCKALHMSWGSGFSWKNIEIRHEIPGYPVVVLSDTAQAIFRDAGLSQIEISIAHTELYAVASAVAWGEL